MSKDLFHEAREADAFTPSKESPVNDAIARRVIPTHLTKAACEGNAEMIADLVKSGNYNALDVATKMKWMIATLEQAGKLIQEDCVNEIEKHSGKANINGAEVIKKEVGVKYSFDECGDREWNEFFDAECEAEEKRKSREKFLKSLMGTLTIVNEQTGEIVTLNPPIKSSTTNVQITFK